MLLKSGTRFELDMPISTLRQPWAIRFGLTDVTTYVHGTLAWTMTVRLRQ